MFLTAVLDYKWGDEDAGWSTLQLLRLDRALAKIPVILSTGARRRSWTSPTSWSGRRVRVEIKPFDIDTLTVSIAEEVGGVTADRRDASTFRLLPSRREGECTPVRRRHRQT